MKRIFSLGVLLAAVIFLLASPDLFAGIWDHYKYSQPIDQNVAVPDVNKPDRNGDGVWPDANDNSCWQAAAANLLAAAGYGTNALNPTPQGRADAIYGQLNMGLGIQNLGCADLAINYWLYNFGKNPNSPDFLPGNAYTDVTMKVNFAGLNMADYNFLMGELDRCQYVAVSFDMPPHCMTLVGGNNPSPPAMNPNWTALSVWHDSDRNNAAPGDDVYTSDFGPAAAKWDLIEYPASNAQRYITLCPGLNKDVVAMQNYDVAYFKQDPDQDGNWTPGFREAGLKAPVYADPLWLPTTNDFIVEIGNEKIDNMSKEIYLLVDYFDRVPNRDTLELLTLKVVDPTGVEVTLGPTSVTSSTDDGQLLFVWKLDFQPNSEQIVFPDVKYQTLLGNVKDWDVATKCVPEPGVLILLAMAFLMLAPRLCRRK